jgi:arylsulfatase A-like enzyme
MTSLSRRDFLKVGASLSGALAVNSLPARALPGAARQANARNNILILVLDAMSATNLSLYGYPRKTTPNFERFAERATVFHQHYSTGNFTTPGTASLLTGLYPWTHRAINMSGLIVRDRAQQNLFRALGPDYHRLAFSQNLLANYFFDQFRGDIEETLSPASFGMMESPTSIGLGSGWMDADRAIGDVLFKEGYGTGSLVFGLAERLRRYGVVAFRNTPDYPTRLPFTVTPVFYQLKDVFDGLIATIETLSPPSAAYMHLWSPHDPYVASKAFAGIFLDGWAPEPKRSHRLVDPHRHHSARIINENRRQYDEYIANLDDEFGRLIDALSAKGVLDSSYLIVTSDHGEMFERGMMGHESPLLYDPLVRIPLLISAPGQSSRGDVHTPTSSVDILPTVLQLAGQPAAAWSEGQTLPELGGHEDHARSLFMMEAKTEWPSRPLQKASFAIRKGRYKLIDYMGYPNYRVQHRFEMYDMDEDPQELNDIYSETMSAAVAMRDELLGRIESTNAQAEG